jgi:hypothetical protein
VFFPSCQDPDRGHEVVVRAKGLQQPMAVLGRKASGNGCIPNHHAIAR